MNPQFENQKREKKEKRKNRFKEIKKKNGSMGEMNKVRNLCLPFFLNFVRFGFPNSSFCFGISMVLFKVIEGISRVYKSGEGPLKGSPGCLKRPSLNYLIHFYKRWWIEPRHLVFQSD